MSMIDKGSIVIFRLQLFKPSETFIASQATKISSMIPIFVGRRKFGDEDNASYLLPVKCENFLKIFFYFISEVVLRRPTRYINLLKNKNIKMVHAHFGVDAVYAYKLSRAMSVPLIVTLHGFDVTRRDADMIRSMRPPLINYVVFKKRLFEECQLFVCVSEFIRRAAIDRGFPPHKLKVHYIGVDTEKLSFGNSGSSAGLILHVARLVEKKGTTYLLQAVAKLSTLLPNIRLVIIGEGPLRTSLERQTEDLGISENVQFLGARPHADVIDWMRKATVKCVPSVTASDGDMEGLGIVNLEAAAIGVPVVAFDSGGIGEAVINGVTGFLAPEKDVDSLSDCLYKILSNSDLRECMTIAAREMVEKDFSLKRQTEKLEQIYKSANKN